VPGGATISWQNSSNLSKSGDTGNSKVFTAIGSGDAWIEAYISYGGETPSPIGGKSTIAISSNLSGTFTQADVSYPLYSANSPQESYNIIGSTGGDVTVTFPDFYVAEYTWSGGLTGSGNSKTFSPGFGGFDFTVSRFIECYGTETVSYYFNVTYDIEGCAPPPPLEETPTEIPNLFTPATNDLSQIRIINLSGDIVKEAWSTEKEIIRGLPQGNAYVLKIYSPKTGLTESKKIIIQ